MNRKERRKQQAKDRKQKRLSKEEIEQRLRNNTGPHEDKQVDMRHVFAQQLQEELHKAINKCIPDNEAPDILTIIQCLAYTAATFAATNGIGELEFMVGMRRYVREVREALGLPTEEFEDPQKKSNIILP